MSGMNFFEKGFLHNSSLFLSAALFVSFFSLSIIPGLFGSSISPGECWNW